MIRLLIDIGEAGAILAFVAALVLVLAILVGAV